MLSPLRLGGSRSCPKGLKAAREPRKRRDSGVKQKTGGDGLCKRKPVGEEMGSQSVTKAS